MIFTITPYFILFYFILYYAAFFIPDTSVI